MRRGCAGDAPMRGLKHSWPPPRRRRAPPARRPRRRAPRRHRPSTPPIACRRPPERATAPDGTTTGQSGNRSATNWPNPTACSARPRAWTLTCTPRPLLRTAPCRSSHPPVVLAATRRSGRNRLILPSPLPACGERPERIEDAIRVRGILHRVPVPRKLQILVPNSAQTALSRQKL